MAEKRTQTKVSTVDKQQRLQNEFQKDLTQLESNINVVLSKHNTNINSMHQRRINQLRKLIVKKTEIEKEIVKVTTELKKGYELSKDVFEVVISSRVRECNDSIEQLSKVIGEPMLGHSEGAPEVKKVHMADQTQLI